MTETGGQLFYIYDVRPEGKSLAGTELRANHLATLRIIPSVQPHWNGEYRDLIAINGRYFVNVIWREAGNWEMGIHVYEYSNDHGRVALPPTYFRTRIDLRAVTPLVSPG
jgi:hypothetical protein